MQFPVCILSEKNQVQSLWSAISSGESLSVSTSGTWNFTVTIVMWIIACSVGLCPIEIRRDRVKCQRPERKRSPEGHLSYHHSPVLSTHPTSFSSPWLDSTDLSTQFGKDFHIHSHVCLCCWTWKVHARVVGGGKISPNSSTGHHFLRRYLTFVRWNYIPIRLSETWLQSVFTAIRCRGVRGRKMEQPIYMGNTDLWWKLWVFWPSHEHCLVQYMQSDHTILRSTPSLTF